jgi:hypothetical protein
MSRKRETMVVVFVIACLTLPLCCFPVCAIFPSYPMFWGRFTVANESDETLYVTPIGVRTGQQRVLLELSSRFPYAPLFKRADVRLGPGESVQIYGRSFDEPPWALASIVVRNKGREYRQLIIDEPTSILRLDSGPTYVVESFSALARATPDAAGVAKKAGRLHLAAWGMIAAGFVPVGLFWVLLRLSRELREERRSESAPSATQQGAGDDQALERCAHG